jgi:hypothetical protein
VADAASRRWTAVEVALLLLVIAPLAPVLVPAHWTSIWMDREFQGWMIAVANRLASGPRLYADGAHSPMPPLPYVLMLLVGGGRGVWLTESALNFAFQSLILFGMYAALRSCARPPVPLCATLAAAPVVFAIQKTALHDSVAQCWVAWATLAVVRGVAPDLTPAGARWWLRGAALLNALCALSKQSTGAGLLVGIVAAHLLADRARPARRRLARAAAHAGWTLGLAAAVALALAPLLSVRGLLEDVYLHGAEPKGGAGEALRNLGRYATQAAPLLATHGPVALGLAWLARRGARAARPGRAPAPPWPLAAASVLTATAVLGLILVWGAVEPRAWSTAVRRLPGLYPGGFRVLWTGLCLGLLGAAWTLWRPSPAREEPPWTAMVLVLVPTALAHNLSTLYLRWTYDNNPLVVAALAWVAREGVAAAEALGTRSRLAAHAALGVTMQLGVWLGLQPQLAVARRCTDTWAEVAHLRGARLRPEADRMRQLVRAVRELAPPGEQVLLVPEDPNVAAWIERPRPALTSAIAFADQYWDRHVDEDFRRLSAAPPRVVVLGPRRFAPRFARAFGNRRWGVERLARRIEGELLPRRYVLQASHVIGFQGQTDRMDVYVRRDARAPDRRG